MSKMFETCVMQCPPLREALKNTLRVMKALNCDQWPYMGCNDSGLSIQSVDPTSACLVWLKLDRDGFRHFHCEGSHKFDLSMRDLACPPTGTQPPANC